MSARLRCPPPCPAALSAPEPPAPASGLGLLAQQGPGRAHLQMRRRLLAGAGALACLGLAGCSGPAPENVSGTSRALPEQKGHQPKAWPYAPPGWQIERIAQYLITARVLGTERYRLDDFSEIATWDFALAWGPAAASEVQAALSISQSNRWYYWRAKKLPLPQTVLNEHMANVHLVPANASIEQLLGHIKRGMVVQLQGSLINAQHLASKRWYRSSTTRSDRGGGACEILLVEQVGLASS